MNEGWDRRAGQHLNNMSTSHQDIPVGVDAVSQASDEEREVHGGEEEGGERHKHHPALQ